MLANKFISQGPHSQIFMMGEGEGVRQRFIFYTQKITTSGFVYPKNSLLLLAYPKKSLSPFFTTQKIPLFFFATQKILTSFIDPKKSLFCQNFRPKKITRTPPSLKYVSGAPGVYFNPVQQMRNIMEDNMQ